MKVKDKVFLVTGAGGGIGSELALILLARGAKVAAVDLREEYLKNLTEQAGGMSKKLSVHALDITDKKAVLDLPKEVIAAQGSIDAVINCAGIIQPFLRVNDLEYETIERVMNTNFYGTLYMVKAFLPYLLKRPEAQIVNVSSMGGFLPVPGQTVYGASKAAVKLLTEGLYAELLNTNVRVTAVFPGATKTQITENSGLKGPKTDKDNSGSKNIPMLSAQIAAEIIINGVEKNKTYIFTGKDSNLMSFLYRLNPLFTTRLIARQMKSLLENSGS